MRTNIRKGTHIRTHEGAPAGHLTAEQLLRRSVMAHMLWEDTFYEDGVLAADRLRERASKVDQGVVGQIAIEARTHQKMRHAPLALAAWMRPLRADIIEGVIQRADEMGEFLSLLYGGQDRTHAIPRQVKLGIQRAFDKFDEYQLAKYDRPGGWTMKDVVFATHPKSDLATKVVEGTLKTPDTWEVRQSAGEGKAGWESLLAENKLGAMALLRNLRNMTAAGVSHGAIERAILSANFSRVLPFRFVAAERACPWASSILEEAFLRSMADKPKLPGLTVVLVDVSGSMQWSSLGGKSDMTRLDSACALAAVLRERCERARVFSFSNELREVPDRRGFGLIDAIKNSQPNQGTYLGRAVQAVSLGVRPMDRLVVVTDEQSHDVVHRPVGVPDCWMLNVAAYQNGVGFGDWQRIDGWSEACVDWIFYNQKERA